ncbi:MAG: hypothetical protein ACE5D4_01615 [Thermodesulfobacteriota bacterium]
MKRGIAVIVTFCALLFVVTGCGNKVHSKVAPQFRQSVVGTIAVVPVRGDTGSEGGRELFRGVVIETLSRSGYTLISAEEVDKRLSSLTTGEEIASGGAGREAIIRALDADGVLFINITKWDASRLLYYASIEIGVIFEIYSRSGKEMWRAEYTLGDADLNSDSDYLKFSVHDTYEPMVVNIVDRVLATLPLRPRMTSRRKGLYDWLP